MQRFLDRTKSKFSSKDRPQQASQQQEVLNNDGAPGAPSIQPPTLQDATRYRYHHGCNIGSIFVLERWLTPHMFPQEAIGSSELAAAQYWVKYSSLEGARDRFQKHWTEFTTDEDLDWLRDVGHVTTVRLPIGYWTLGPEHCKGTAFEKVGGLYESAWGCVRLFVDRLYQRGIGTLIDVHGLPGGANGNDHSGTNNGKAELWSSKKNRALATKVMCFIAEEAKSMNGVAGLQIINEAEWAAKGMYEWYGEVLKAVEQVDPTLLIYVSDAWNLDAALSWSKGQNQVSDGHRNPVVVDTHLYWCFDEKDRHKSPRQISDEVLTKLGGLDTREGSVHNGGAAQVIVGEYSCVLAEEAWSKGTISGQSKEELVALFGRTQSSRYQERAGGSFFWTYKMDWIGGEWGFKQMTEQYAIVHPKHLALTSDEVTKRIDIAQAQRDGRRGNDWGSHCSWWDGNHPGEYEHWRFEKGWTLGWDDAIAFFGMRNTSGYIGGDKIGMLDLWILKRLRESDQTSSFVWEWEHGFRQGVKAFYEAAGISGNLQA